jgi:aminoglycoside phosphotransferase (APT) family kinase protein
LESGLEQGRVDLDRLVARIRVEFPDLPFSEARLNDFGEDHAVVVLDEKTVFRFPRNAEYAARAAGERRLLGSLGELTSIPTPRYRYVSITGDFAGYPMIQGEQLTEAVFAGLPRRTQARILGELGRFLACLHSLPIGLLAAADGALPKLWRGTDYARRYGERRARLASRLGAKTMSRLDAFFLALPHTVDVEPSVIVHDDMTSDHVLLSPDRRRLGGVIDFSDAAHGDPAFDFTFFWAYGDWAPALVADAYGALGDREGVMTRSRWWFLRYSVDRLLWDETKSRACDVPAVTGDLVRTLDALGL